MTLPSFHSLSSESRKLSSTAASRFPTLRTFSWWNRLGEDPGVLTLVRSLLD